MSGPWFRQNWSPELFSLQLWLLFFALLNRQGEVENAQGAAAGVDAAGCDPILSLGQLGLLELSLL